MIETSTTNIPKEPPVKRRIEKDEENRNYKCPCGKTYLSYPALFTHIKQKHDGKAPGQIGKPKGNNKGRPPIKKLEDKLQNNNTSILSSLCEYFEAIIQQDNKKIQNLYYLYKDKNCLQQKIPRPSEQFEKNKQKPCRDVFSELLEQIQNMQFVSSNLTKQRIMIFLNIWMEHFLEKQKQLEGEQPLYTAEFLNEFIVEYLPQFVSARNLRSLEFLKSEHAISITYSIHNWMFEKKYTADQVFRSPSTSDHDTIES